MTSLVTRYTSLKKSIGGNREIMRFECTFGEPKNESVHITAPNRDITRILAELDFSIKLSHELGGKFDGVISDALTMLESELESEGTLTRTACAKAEDILMPLAPSAKEYKIILAGHAHMDMNWMWSWNETVALTLATIKTVLQLMREYPDFCFSQSQASVYKIVEDFEPELMDEIKMRIAQGRWEVTASAWVETDKNMPDTESLLRHIKYTKNYMQDVWGISPDSLELDFSPDTFGHSANLPEIDAAGNVKYYYHCRGLSGQQTLYRWRAPSGKELLCYTEQNWYNSGITPGIGLCVFEIAKRSFGFKTSLVVYGMGDHGGGPTRCDIERAIDQMSWKIWPTIKFGTIKEFFHEADKVRESFPVIDKEMNFIFPGCYTTQSRIKLGNRTSENALLRGETMSACASFAADMKHKNSSFENAWRDVLFTHFHDILTGSCVQDTREHAMGLYSNSTAVANTQLNRAMLALSDAIDNSAIAFDEDISGSRTSGAGVGYNTNTFAGYPVPERGNGITRIFNVFNPLPYAREENVELAVWDWSGDLRYLKAFDTCQKPLEIQKIDNENRRHWDHNYFRFTVRLSLPAMGYTTFAITQAEREEYKIYLNGDDRVFSEREKLVLENEYVKAVFDDENGRLMSLCDSQTGEEYLAPDAKGGFCLVTTESKSSDAWHIGTYLSQKSVKDTVKISRLSRGNLSSEFSVEYTVLSSTVKVTYSLAKGARAVKARAEIDWNERAYENATVPVLTYRLPLKNAPAQYLYDVPAGVQLRAPMDMDVPALKYAAAPSQSGKSVMLMTNCKYGFRGTANGSLAVTLLNTANYPDKAPERFIHNIDIYFGVCETDAKRLTDTAVSLLNPPVYIPAPPHKGTLPASGSFFSVESGSCVISSVGKSDDGCLLIRLYEVMSQSTSVTVALSRAVESAMLTDIFENAVGTAQTDENKVSFDVSANSIVTVKIRIKE